MSTNVEAKLDKIIQLLEEQLVMLDCLKEATYQTQVGLGGERGRVLRISTKPHY